jgi:ribosomal protein S17
MTTRKLRIEGMNQSESGDEVNVKFSRPLSKLEFQGLELLLTNLIQASNNK